MATILIQTATTISQIPSEGIVIPVITVAFLAYLLYKSVWVKEPAFRETLTGAKAIVPILTLVAFALAPASILVVFGAGAEIVQLYVLPILMGLLVSFTLASVVTWVDMVVQAEKKIPGF